MARRKKKLNHTNNHLRYFIRVIFLIIFVYGIYSLLTTKNNENNISESQMVSRYYEPAVFVKPISLQSFDKIISFIPKKQFRIPIIMYHYVEYVKDPLDTIRKSLNIPPYILEQELQVLNDSGYGTLFVRELPEIISQKKFYNPKSVFLTFDDGYEDFYTDVFPLLKKYHTKATVYVIYNFIGRKGFLNEKQIKELIDSQLVEIGSHTLDHFYLKKSSQLIALEQILNSKKMLEKKFKIKVESFAYPYGAFDQNAINLTRSSGYSAAVSVIPGINQSEDNLFYLSRLGAGNFSYNNMINYIENYIR